MGVEIRGGGIGDAVLLAQLLRLGEDVVPGLEIQLLLGLHALIIDGDEQLAVQGGLKVVHDGALADAGLAAEEDGAGALALAEALDAGQQQQHLLLPAKEVFRRVLSAGLGGAAAAQLGRLGHDLLGALLGLHL